MSDQQQDKNPKIPCIIQPNAKFSENFKQSDVLYTHLLLVIPRQLNIEPVVHLGCDNKNDVERAYDEGETSKTIFKWRARSIQHIQQIQITVIFQLYITSRLFTSHKILKLRR